MNAVSLAVAADGEGRSPTLGDTVLQSLAQGTIDSSALDRFLALTDEEALAAWVGDTPPGQARAQIDYAIAAIDSLLSEQINAIIAHPRFAALESAWRGVRWLAMGLGIDDMSRIRLLDARWHEIGRDFERAPEFDKSALFDLVYSQEFDMPGGVPFSMLIGLYDVQHRPTRGRKTDDVEILRHLAAVGAAAFAPIILDAAPGLFGVDNFGDMDLRQTLAADFRNPAYMRLRSFQDRPDARFIGVVAPRIRLRGPWRGRQVGDCGFRYEPDERQSLWGAGGLAIGHVVLRAFNDYRWPASVRGLVRDELTAGLVATLPVVDFETDAPGKIVKFPVEVQLSEGLDRELAEAGFISVRRVKDTPYLAIHNMPSLHKPTTTYDTEIARTNQQLGTMLNYILCVSRFAHYIKIIGREWIGALKSADEIEQRLQRWLNQYISSGNDVSFEQKARYPLQEARIAVRELPGTPGSYECGVALKPHFQLDQAISEFHLVTIMKEPGAA
jgi:type VI secretion system protein ImpD